MGTLLDALETFVGWPTIRSYFPWALVRTRYRSLVRQAKPVSSAQGSLRILAIPTGIAATAAAIWFPAGSPTLVLLCLVVFVGQLLKNARLIYGLDGSDQMQVVLWGSLTAFSVSPHGAVAYGAAIFIAAQLILSYLSSGVAKLFGKDWRSGQAVGYILRTNSHGSAWAARFLKRFKLSRAISWATVAFEIAMPLVVLVGNTRLTVGMLVVGVLFHAAIAVVIGLNTFFWQFTATYPCVLFVSTHVPWT